MCPEVREVQYPLAPDMFLPYPVRTLRASLSLSARWGAWGLVHREIRRTWNIHSCSHSCMHACIRSHSKYVLRICLGQGQAG